MVGKKVEKATAASLKNKRCTGKTKTGRKCPNKVGSKYYKGFCWKHKSKTPQDGPKAATSSASAASHVSTEPTASTEHSGPGSPSTPEPLPQKELLNTQFGFSYADGNRPTDAMEDEMKAQFNKHFSYALQIAQTAFDIVKDRDWLYQRYFGDSEAYFETVMEVFRKITNLKYSDRSLYVVFQGHPPERHKRAYAYVEHHEDVYLNTSKYLGEYADNDDWFTEGLSPEDRGDAATDMLAITLIHELTHVNGIGEFCNEDGEMETLRDVPAIEGARNAVGFGDTQALARSSPRDAYMNAENYALFALECWWAFLGDQRSARSDEAERS